MKRAVLLVLFLISVAVGYCIRPHLRFLDIPIDGSIATFSRALKSKGWIVHPASKKMPVGQRYFVNQTSMRNDHYFVVSYDPGTGTVYAVTTVQELSDWKSAMQLFNVQSSILMLEYVDGQEEYSTVIFESEDPYPMVEIDVINDNCELLGTITCRIDYDMRVFDKIILFVEYSDHINRNKYFKP